MKIFTKLFEKIRETPLVKNILFFAAILGPGVITGSVDNDAGGITTYSVAGAARVRSYLDFDSCFVALVVVRK
jgi:hypothetical protein